MPSQLCALDQAPSELLDDIVLNEAAYILDDMDESSFSFGVDSAIVRVDELLRAALDFAPDRQGKVWFARIIYATDGSRRRLLEVAQSFFREVLMPMKVRGIDVLHRPTKSPRSKKDLDEFSELSISPTTHKNQDLRNKAS
ncbi:hypothetical protein FRB99_000857 [Tulasnella sp. 403]|nr:hypothetical protein FRB99_000857 [Tulasnella sp. 403]